jgi:signal transduction histidine kinase
MRRVARVAVVLAVVAPAFAVAAGWNPALAYVGSVGVVTVALVLFIADRVASLRQQLVLAGAATAAGLVASVALLVDAMYVSSHDALFTLLLSGYGLLLGGWAAWLLGRRALRRLEDAERARRDVVTAVSHELRTPLASLRLLAEAVDDGIVDADERHDYLTRMTTHIQALSSMIADLFELSRLEAGDVRWSMERVPLDSLVMETVEALRPHAEAHGVAVQAKLHPGLRSARADAEQLQRVLFNLIQNAIRHTPAAGVVVVRAEPVGREVQIEVADSGAGIHREREHASEGFLLGGTGATRATAGASVGLAISRAIVEAHGGRIWLAGSRPGSRLRFTLPSGSCRAAAWRRSVQVRGSRSRSGGGARDQPPP